jgi:hypothetical protein
MYLPERVVAYRTGNVVKKNVVSLFGREMYKQSSEFQNYEVVTSVRYLFGIIPVRIITYEMHEVGFMTVRATYEEALTDLINIAKNEAESMIPTGTKILNRWYIEIEIDNVKYVEYYYEVEERLA